MSNLLKYNTVQCESDAKVIDYNDLIAEKLNGLQNVSKRTNVLEEVADENGFQAGIYAKEVAIAEETQEMEEPESTPEEILENARQQAEQMIAKAKQQVEQIKQEAYQQASKDGYDEGYNQAIAEVEEQKKELEKKREKLIKDYQNQLKEMEPMLVDAITTVIQSVFKIKFEDNRNLIIHLLKIALGQIEGSNEFVVKVSKKDYPFVLKYKDVLDKATIKASNINIIEDGNLTKNQCLIETDGGVFDCSLDVQLDNLTKTLKILSLS